MRAAGAPLLHSAAPMTNPQKPVTKPKRGPRGRFLSGNREGPGRPKGARNRTTLLVEELLENEAEELTRALIRRAKAGYSVPLQLVFERLAPPRKDRHVTMTLPAITSLDDVLAAQAAIIKHTAAGELTPSEAHSMAALLDLRRRTIEAIEIEARLAALEAQLATRPAP